MLFNYTTYVKTSADSYFNIKLMIIRQCMLFLCDYHALYRWDTQASYKLHCHAHYTPNVCRLQSMIDYLSEAIVA